MKLINRLAPWVVGALVLTITMAALYLATQRTERMGADDAGDRLASQVASQLDSGGTASTGAPDRVDLATSLAPFWILYDKSGSPVDGSGYLDGALGTVPVGVIDQAFASGSNRVTWQPAAGLRFATVELRSGDQVVLAAQSLAPSESRTDSVGLLLLVGWLAAVILLAIGALVQLRMERSLD
ncbi:MAG: hypothetical protein ABJB03_03205 [Rhodoglobus sp.]